MNAISSPDWRKPGKQIQDAVAQVLSAYPNRNSAGQFRHVPTPREIMNETLRAKFALPQVEPSSGVSAGCSSTEGSATNAVGGSSRVMNLRQETMTGPKLAPLMDAPEFILETNSQASVESGLRPFPMPRYPSYRPYAVIPLLVVLIVPFDMGDWDLIIRIYCGFLALTLAVAGNRK